MAGYTAPMADRAASKKPTGTDRETRLKAALKANMAKRKAQARARAEQSTDEAEQTDTTRQADG